MRTYDLDVRRLSNIAICAPGDRVVSVLQARLRLRVTASFPGECLMCRLAINRIEYSPVSRMKIGNAGQIVAVDGPTPGLESESSSIGGHERRNWSPELLEYYHGCRHAAHKHTSCELHVPKPHRLAILSGREMRKHT